MGEIRKGFSEEEACAWVVKGAQGQEHREGNSRDKVLAVGP